MSDKPPRRGAKHDALDVFLGNWQASGTSYGGTDQSGDPKANGEPWTSTHSAHWHTGSFFLFQDERAIIADKPFDTFSVFGVDPATGLYFARTFENHGFYRDYRLTVSDNIWSLTAQVDRLRPGRSGDDDRRQSIVWEWKPGNAWLPLCDRTATRID